MKQKRQSFSLIELLAVIAVIGILVGIGVGGYSYAMNSAKESATRSARVPRVMTGKFIFSTRTAIRPTARIRPL